ncbi:MAG: bifunctional folylpolyglutamate synthase/dihydrofolate synthase [Nitrospirae bacterium]|nr:bifunctional folylpolyglutamate synthase/dihydrofolate synthase [Nitrospirota bacterium]
MKDGYPSAETHGYTESIDYLYSLQRHGIKLGLQNTLKLMDILGRPDKSFHSVHIAGTNGKGSTSAIIAGILKESGFKTGLFTSPHFVSFTERIRINGVPISEYDVISLTSYIRNAAADTEIKPTFFEVVTAMAFYYFMREKVDWVVVETGMGGRLDATNVLSPEVSVITNIGLDHTEFLGKSITEIASEKAGIIKTGAPVVTAAVQPEVLNIINEAANSRGASLHLYGRDFEGSLSEMDISHIKFNYKGYNNYDNLKLKLTGKHQVYNASLAVRVCEILMQRGIQISEDAIYNGLSKLHFEGRLETASQKPYIILDGAHNPKAAETLSASLKELCPGKEIILVTGIMKDKDMEGILKPLADISSTIILTRPHGERAAEPEMLMECVENLQKDRSKPMPELIIKESVSDAVELSKALWHEKAIILITGSFYTTGEAKEALGYKGVFSKLRE